MCSSLAIACGGDEEDGGNGGSGGGGGGACASGVICAADANNYSFMSTLMVAETAVMPRTELSFDWSALTQDFSMHDISPTGDIDMVSVIIWRVDNAELAVKLNEDDLSQQDFEAIAMVYTENAITDAKLFEFTEFGEPIDSSILVDYLDPTLFPPENHAYTVMASTGEEPGKGTRMVQGFRMDDTSTNSTVTLDVDSTTMEHEVDLTSLRPVTVPAGKSDLTIDWSELDTNAMGAEFDPRAITEVVVGKFSQTPTELEGMFLDLDLIAQELYWGDVLAGSSFSLQEAATRADMPVGSAAGTAFSGIDDSGTWLVGLRCGTCTNPAPWFLTILQPGAGT
jgi:hypothetical protein